MSDKELMQRYRMALEAIVAPEGFSNFGLYDARAIARTALKEKPDDQAEAVHRN